MALEEAKVLNNEAGRLLGKMREHRSYLPGASAAGLKVETYVFASMSGDIVVGSRMYSYFLLSLQGKLANTSYECYLRICIYLIAVVDCYYAQLSESPMRTGSYEARQDS